MPQRCEKRKYTFNIVSLRKTISPDAALKKRYAANSFLARCSIENDDTRLARLREVGDVAQIVRIELQIDVSRVLFGEPARNHPGRPRGAADGEG